MTDGIWMKIGVRGDVERGGRRVDVAGMKNSLVVNEVFNGRVD